TNNLPDCSNMCHESSGTALGEVIGVGKGTVTLDDFEKADAIFIIGQNPGTNHPRMMSWLQKAKRNGCTIVSINPLPEAGTIRFKNPQEVFDLLGPGTRLSDLFLQVRINGDSALLQGIIKEMLEEEQRNPGTVLDRAFIEERTSGFESLTESIRRLSWPDIVEQSGIEREEIRKAARVAIDSKATIVCWAMGLTQHKNAVATIQDIVNLLLLRGNIGRPGAGVCPVRGHSNVQGDRTMGIWENPKPEFLDALSREMEFEPPRKPGFHTVEAIRAMHDGRAKVFFAMGGNFLSATPDTLYTAEALKRCRLTAHVSTKLNRAHTATGKTALILPCLGRSEIDLQAGGEQFVTVEDSMGIVSASRGKFAPASEDLRSEPAIIAGVARAALGSRTNIDWEALVANYDRIRDRIERVVSGFQNFNQRIRVGSFSLPNPARDGEFRTSDGRAHFTAHPLPRHLLQPGQYMMMTIRSHDQFNTTIYGLDDRYRGIYGGRRVVFMHPDDVEEAGLRKGDLVDLRSHFDDGERLARRFSVVPFSIPRRCTATYFPEANVLVPVGSFADKSHTPTSKSVIITIERSA
ncbi:MAG TPA: FdhF/YdeP family oxidoreductase, partial [Thermoanaerobaculia bacterium]|nr:FdhF/YdeP family oxidoreductase [Thermoanaerobaculia bacterium]